MSMLHRNDLLSVLALSVLVLALLECSHCVWLPAELAAAAGVAVTRIKILSMTAGRAAAAGRRRMQESVNVKTAIGTGGSGDPLPDLAGITATSSLGGVPAVSETRAPPDPTLSVLISSNARGKFNPSLRLKLLGNITASDRVVSASTLSMAWLVQRYASGGALETVQLQTTTGLASQNLVVLQSKLEPGERYRFKLSAVTADGSASGQAAVDVLTNRPPLVGLLESSPGTGMAVVDRSKTPTISSMFPLERSKNSVCYTYLAAFMPPFF